MRFVALGIRNFLSYGDVETIIPLSSQGATLISGYNSATGGHNGVGKSAIIDAFFWTLFGRPLRNISVSDITNFHTGRNTHCWLEFYYRGHHYRIDRYRKHKQHGNSVIITIDGNRSEERSSIIDDQKRLETDLGLDPKTFLSNFIFTSDSTPFLGLTPSKRFDELEARLGLLSFTEAAKRARQKVRTCEDGINSHNGQLASLYKQHDDIRYRLYNLKQEAEQHRQQLEKKKDELRKEVAALERELQELESATTENTIDDKRVNSLKRLLDNYSREVSDIAALERNIELDINKLESALRTLEDTYDIKKKGITRSYEAKIKEIDGKQSLLDAEICPTCERPWGSHGAVYADRLRKAKEEAKQAHDAAIAELNKEKDRQRGAIEYELKSLRSKLSDTRDKKEAAKLKLDNTKEEYDRLLQQLSAQEAKLEAIENKKAMLKRLLNEKRAQLDNLDSDGYDRLITELESQLRDIEDNINEVKNDKSKLEQEIKYYRLWQDGFSGSLKHFVIKSIIDSLNNQLNASLRLLFDDGSAQIYIHPSMEVLIKLHGKTVSYWNLSQGERKRFDVATFLTLYSFACSMNPDTSSNVLWFDEVFDSGLDQKGVMSVAQLLRSLGVESSFVISHRIELSSLFDNVIELEKIGAFTKIRGL